MATARDIKGLRRFKWQEHVSSSPKAMLRWRDEACASSSALRSPQAAAR